MKVTIKPMPESYRSIPVKWLPGIPPIFPGCRHSGPAKKEIALAQELFTILDEQSKDWYRRCCPRLFGDL